MSPIVDAAVRKLNDRLDGGFDGIARFAITGEGALTVDSAGARAGDDGPTDVTLTADAATFQALLEGRLDPARAYMQGRISVDGDLGCVMRLARTMG